MNHAASIELRCSRDLALKLDAIEPQSLAEHRALRRTHLLVRTEDGVMFWPWATSLNTVTNSS